MAANTDYLNFLNKDIIEHVGRYMADTPPALVRPTLATLSEPVGMVLNMKFKNLL